MPIPTGIVTRDDVGLAPARYGHADANGGGGVPNHLGVVPRFAEVGPTAPAVLVDFNFVVPRLAGVAHWGVGRGAVPVEVFAMPVVVSGMLKSMPFGEFLGVRFGLFSQGVVPVQRCHAHFGPRCVVHVKGAFEVVVDAERLGHAFKLEGQQAHDKKGGKGRVHGPKNGSARQIRA